MFFYISKIVGFFLVPSNLIAFMIVAGLLLTMTRLRRTARILILSGTATLLVLGLSPAGNLLILPLEERFSVKDPASVGEPTGIIVLGGGVSAGLGAARGQLAVNSAGERVTEFIALAHTFPNARHVYSSGSAAILYEKFTEADELKKYYGRTGLDPAGLTLERASRTTYENALFTKELIKPKPGERWLLVTSAYHMPRAVGCFRKVGLDVIPYPVDFRTRGWPDQSRLFEKISDGLARIDSAAHEWLGLIAYWFTGRTSTLFPGP